MNDFRLLTEHIRFRMLQFKQTSCFDFFISFTHMGKIFSNYSSYYVYILESRKLRKFYGVKAIVKGELNSLGTCLVIFGALVELQEY